MDLTPEKRAEWREDAEWTRRSDHINEAEDARRIITLLDALDKAERDAEGWRERWKRDTDLLEDEAEAAEARATELEARINTQADMWERQGYEVIPNTLRALARP